jgi:hypothetical protein
MSAPKEMEHDAEARARQYNAHGALFAVELPAYAGATFLVARRSLQRPRFRMSRSLRSD